MNLTLFWLSVLLALAIWAWSVRYAFTKGRANGWPTWMQAAAIPLPAVVLLMHFLPPRR